MSGGSINNCRSTLCGRVGAGDEEDKTEEAGEVFQLPLQVRLQLGYILCGRTFLAVCNFKTDTLTFGK